MDWSAALAGKLLALNKQPQVLAKQLQCLIRTAGVESIALHQASVRDGLQTRQNIINCDFSTFRALLHRVRECCLDLRFFQVFIADFISSFRRVTGANRGLGRVQVY